MKRPGSPLSDVRPEKLQKVYHLPNNFAIYDTQMSQCPSYVNIITTTRNFTLQCPPHRTCLDLKKHIAQFLAQKPFASEPKHVLLFTLESMLEDSKMLGDYGVEFRSEVSIWCRVLCQVCLENGFQEDATHWCKTCSTTPDSQVEFFCGRCDAQEHSTRNGKTHGRFPVHNSGTSYMCPKHKIPETCFCFTDNMFICYTCTQEDHQTHTTRHVAHYSQDEINTEFKSPVFGPLTTLKLTEKQAVLRKLRQEKFDEIKRLQHEIVAIDTKISLQDHFMFAGLFSFPWTCTLLGRIPNDLKPQIRYYLVHATITDKPSLKETYACGGKIGSEGGRYGEFRSPNGVVVDRFGNIFVADTSNNRIQIFQRDGNFIKAFGSKGDGDSQFFVPMALAFDFEGNLVVLDAGNHRIQIFDRSGVFKTKFGSKGAEDGQFDPPSGLTIDNDGNIVVSDYKNHRVQIFTPTGTWLKKFGSRGNAPGQLANPVGVACDVFGNYIVSERVNSRIQIFSSTGQHIRMFGLRGALDGQFQDPWGVTTDKIGNIIVADRGNHRIQIFTNDGQFLLKFGAEGKQRGQLDWPVLPVLDKTGNLIIVDSRNHRLQIFGENVPRPAKPPAEDQNQGDQTNQTTSMSRTNK